jgi:1,4-alpha-glucan branching enzyme
MEKGYLAIILHAHLPFVRHPEYETFLEEDWFYEAITESYIPLLEMLEGLADDHIDFRLTLSLSPTLLSMMSDPLLQKRYILKLDRLVDLSGKELERTRDLPEYNKLALNYHNNFLKCRELFVKKYQKNLVPAFKYFYNKGNLEIITSSATHAFLPLMNKNHSAITAQVQVAVEYFRKLFGMKPEGLWLPECGYEPGLDAVLKKFSVRYFFVDAHGVLNAAPRPKYGVFAPIICPSGVAAFARDVASSKQVWSSHAGFPGDPYYREFYRDIGYDLDYEYIKPYLHGDGIRINTGIKYYRITGADADKKPYDPEIARQKAAEHANAFVRSRKKQVEYLYDFLGRVPVVVTPFDAELFGHWWYEGPQWLDLVIRKSAAIKDVLRMITPSEYLDLPRPNQISTPSRSSWGWKGYYEAWLNSSNDWIYRHLHKAAKCMVGLAGQFPAARGVILRALNQASRELLLAQSSDWAFIMKTNTVSGYAVKRTETHLANFFRLHDDLLKGSVDKNWLKDLENKHNIFPDIDYRIYA